VVWQPLSIGATPSNVAVARISLKRSDLAIHELLSVAGANLRRCAGCLWCLIRTTSERNGEIQRLKHDIAALTGKAHEAAVKNR
jgi:hypothetical protein